MSIYENDEPLLKAHLELRMPPNEVKNPARQAEAYEYLMGELKRKFTPGKIRKYVPKNEIKGSKQLLEEAIEDAICDVLAEMSVGLLPKEDTVIEDVKLMGYLIMACRNKFVGYLRKIKHENPYSINEQLPNNDEKAVKDLTELTDENEEHDNFNEVLQHLPDCVNRLKDDKDKTICRLYMDGLNQKGIAKQFDMTPTAILNRMNRNIRPKIAECIDKKMGNVYFKNQNNKDI